MGCYVSSKATAILSVLDGLIEMAQSLLEESKALRTRLIADPTVDTTATDAAEAEYIANLPDEESDR